MIFDIIDFNDDVATILGTLEANSKKAQLTREKINKLQADITPEAKGLIEPADDIFKEAQEEKSQEDEKFEDEVEGYITDYDRLKSGFTEDDLMEILPSPTDYRYMDVIRRLLAESVRNIMFYKSVIFKENVGKEELEGIKELIELENRKKTCLSKILKDEKEETTEEAKNKIVLVPTSSGSIRILEELKAVPLEFREPFQELIDSIIDGSFKNKRSFTNNRKLAGFTEVKGHQVRIVFSRLGLDTYGLITAFIKKTDNSKGYRDSLKLKLADYKAIEEWLKSTYQTEEFQKENEENIQELKNVLSIEKSTSKKKIKGDNND